MMRKASILCLLQLAVALSHAGDVVLTPEQRLEPARLKSVNDARLRFARERTTEHILHHGGFEDIRAAINVAAGDEAARDRILAAAKQAGVRVVIFADSPALDGEALRGERDGVLYFTASEAAQGLKKFFAPPPLKFVPPVDAYAAFRAEGFAGLQVCSRVVQPRSFKTILQRSAANGEAWKQLNDCAARFPDEVFAAACEPRWDAFELWDKEAQARPFVGIAAAPETGTLAVNGTLFDPPDVALRHLSTHILVRECSESEIRRALRDGNAYIAHDWLCDPSGFIFGAASNFGVFPMGDPVPFITGTTRIVGFTPLPARLKIVRNGIVIEEKVGTQVDFSTRETGSYRLEAWLNVGGEERPWIFSNPVYLKEPWDSIAGQKLPAYEVSPQVAAHKDISYAAGKEEDADKHKLDIYAPKGKKDLPVFFFVHGGAWRTGDRSHYLPLGNRFAGDGLVVVAPSYRLAPKSPFPAQIEDVAAAFAWTVRHIKEYGGDPARIYVGGHSAGGHLSALLTLDGQWLQKHALSAKNIRGTLGLSGVYDLVAIGDSQSAVFGKDRDFRRSASPLFHVKDSAPPFVVTYCQWDYFTLPGQARTFHTALKKAGIASQIVFVPRENHISEMLSITQPDDPTAQAILNFVK